MLSFCYTEIVKEVNASIESVVCINGSHTSNVLWINLNTASVKKGRWQGGAKDLVGI